MSALVLVVPADLDRPTGGNHYDRALAAALTDLGTQVDVRPAAGRWPVAGPTQRRDLAGLLYAEDPVVVDGLVAGGAPHAVETAVDAGAPVHVLVHLPLALETGLPADQAGELEALEGRALRAARGVIATSEWAAADLRRRHGVTAAVARPGTDPAAGATGSVPPQLLHLASVTPRKDQLGVVAALAQIRDLAWTARLTGSLTADPAYVARVRAAIDAAGLGDRVELTGPMTGPVLEQTWARTDLLLLPSHAETWGMVVTEALARGVPVVVGAGTGAQEAFGCPDPGGLDVGGLDVGGLDVGGPGAGGPGAVVPPGDPLALADAVRRLLGPGRAAAVAAARARAAVLPRWPDTARAVLAALR